MKKMILGAAAALLCGSVFAIESANIVGYSKPATTKQSVSWTPMFDVIGNTEMTYKLSDITTAGMAYDADCIQYLDEDTASTYIMAVYLDADTYGEAMAGWYDFNGSFDPENSEDRLDDQEFIFNTSFLALFTGGGEIEMTYSGSVPMTERTVSFTAQSPFFGNYLPTDLTLSQITCSGMAYDADCIQYLDEDTASTYIMAVYLDADTYGEAMAGWYDFNGSFDPENPEDRLDSTPVVAGQGFLGLFTGGNEVAVTFPSPVKK